MKLSELIECVNGTLVYEAKRKNAEKRFNETEIKGLSDDSRHIVSGEVFFALGGGEKDGRDFAFEAAEKGAAAIVAETPVDLSGSDFSPPQIIVKNSRKAIAIAAGAFYGRPAEKMRVVGVTGTNGKTTVTYLLASIFEAAGKKAGIIGTTGIFYGGTKIAPELTTPDPVFLHKTLADMQKNGVDTVLMEVSAHAVWYEKIAGIPFSAKIFTNFSQDHLDFFGNMQTYEKTKTKFFLPDEETAADEVKKSLFVINADDETGAKIIDKAKKCGVNTIAYGLENPSDVFAVITDETAAGSKFLLNLSDELCRAALSLAGRHNVYNALAAAGCAFALGTPLKAVSEGLKNAMLPKGRLQRVRGVCGAEIFVDFAHTPDGLQKSLEALKPLCKGKLYCLFGCGGNRDRGKRAQMGAVAAKKADFSYLTSDNPRYEDPSDIIREIETGFRRFSENYAVLSDRKKAIFYAVNFLKKGDILLIAGKGGEETQEIMGVKYEYDDVSVAEEAVAARKLGETE